MLACLKLLDNTLNNIVNYSLMASEQFLVNLVLFTIQDLVFDVLFIVRPQVKIKGLELFVEAKPTVLQSPLYIDYSNQIVLNLLVNAVQFTKKSEIVLKINVMNTIGGVEFEVRDSRAGIPDNKLQALREKLRSGLEELQINTTGSCLGLKRKSSNLKNEKLQKSLNNLVY